jgi:hypothetical protein
LRVYFMGLFHISYEANLATLLDGLRMLGHDRPDVDISVTLRCGVVRAKALASPVSVTILPFADESAISTDLERADLLYLPLPFDSRHRPLAAFSLSTKMVTYLGSGLPILYHGPIESAAGGLLSRNGAAIICGSNSNEEMKAALASALNASTAETVTAALNLADRRFKLSDIRDRFWSEVASAADNQ